MKFVKQQLEAYLKATGRKRRFTLEVKDDIIRVVPVNHIFTQVDILLLTRFATENGFAGFISADYVDNELRWVIYEPNQL